MKREDTLSSYEFHELMPDEAAAVAWFEAQRWPQGVRCAHCGSDNVLVVKNAKPQPYRCRKCRKHFSCKTGTLMHSSNLPVKKWLYAMYLMKVSKKGLSSLQLGRELGIAQEAAWRLGHKIREAWNQDALFPMTGPVEADATYIGGKEKNKHESKRNHLGRGGIGKQPVVGLRDRTGHVRAFLIEKESQAELHPAIRANVEAGAQLFTDEHGGYRGMREYRHETVAHSAGQYVNGQIHTNGIESFWALLKRGYVGTYHQMSVKHLSRYVDEFCYRHNHREDHALTSMAATARNMEGRRLTHRALVQGEAA